MKNTRIWRCHLCFFIVISAFAAYAPASPPQRDLESIGSPIESAPPDPKIQQVLQQISSEQIRHDIEALVNFHNRNTLSSMETDLKPGLGIRAAADWIEAQFKSDSAACGGCLEVKRDTFIAQPQTRIPRPTVLVNIYAVLRGADPRQSNRMYLVTGHYDSRDTNVLDTHGFAPGANDDASGVAVSLECARVLSKLKFPATLIFAAVAGEEQGLVGSQHLAMLAKQNAWNLLGVFNNDIVGGNTTPGDNLQDKSVVRLFSEGIPAMATPEQLKQLQRLGGESDSPSRELARAISEIAKTYFESGPHSAGDGFHPVLEFRGDRYLRGGDHYSFNSQGFPAVRFTEWREDFNHQHQDVRTENGIDYGDLLKYVDTRYVANVARLNTAAMSSLASAPAPPTNVQIEVKSLGNDSTFEWDDPAGAPAGISYQVLWRETTAPNWQFFANTRALEENGPASKKHRLSLPISKDNVIFGIRSADEAGHFSPAVVPAPKR